MYSPDL
jgi:hypothetical protein